MVKSTMDEFAPAKGDLSGKLFDEIRTLLQKEKKESIPELDIEESKKEILENAVTEENVKLISLSTARVFVPELKSKDVGKMSDKEKQQIREIAA